MSSLKKTIIPFLLIAALILAAAWRQPKEENGDLLSRRQMLMGTVVEITAYGADRQRLTAGITEAFAEMARLEALLGPAEGSDPWHLSRSATGGEVAAETAEVIALGLQVQELSAGALDLTLGHLKNSWGIETARPRVPPPTEIRQALAATGAGILQLEGRAVRKGHPAAAVDLGAVAKGYAVDRAMDVLRRAGAAGAAVNAGGDIRLLGDRQGNPWRIGIQHYQDPERVLGILSLTDTAVVSSGDYERFFEQDGIRYHHLFDPRSGQPARGCRSITVLAASAARADALATAAFVLGPVAGLELLERLPEVEGLIVDAGGQVHLTSGLQGKIEWR